jgi:RNA polymerase sigma factor for flagellar operon FliA
MEPKKKGERKPTSDPQAGETQAPLPSALRNSAVAAYRSANSNADSQSVSLDINQETIEPAETDEQTGQIEYTEQPNRDALVMECLPLVKYIAHRIANRVPSHVDVDDLINSGIIGLINAAERFEPERNIKFKTYAEQRIRGEILDSLRDLDWVPRTLRRKKREIEAAFQEIEQRLGRAATDEEVAEHLAISLDELHKSLDELKGVSLGSFADTETQDGESILTIIPDPDAEDPHATLQESEIRELLKNSVEALPEKERLTVQLYYFNELNMKEIGTLLNITESRVSQLHTKAMLRLRGKLRHRQIDGR